MNNEQLEDLMYRAGLTAQGCWDSMDQYDREAIMDFAKLVAAEKDKEIARLREENVYLKGVYEDLVEDRKELFDDLDKAVAAEREACAKVCDARVIGDHNREDQEAKRCAAAIRARGEV